MNKDRKFVQKTALSDAPWFLVKPLGRKSIYGALATYLLGVSLLPNAMSAQELIVLSNDELDELKFELGVSIETDYETDNADAPSIVSAITAPQNVSPQPAPPPQLVDTVNVTNIVEVTPLALQEAQSDGFERVEEADIFYIGLIDYMLHHSAVNGNLQQFGRAAYYVDGRFGSYEVTSSANLEFDGTSFSQPLQAYKGNRALLGRVRRYGHYSIFGDDSTWIDNAPSEGDFYLNIESDTQKFLWGNFDADFAQSDLIAEQSRLYGAFYEARTQAQTGFGAPRAEASLFASLPNSLTARDVIAGTGGSVYFLDHADILAGTQYVTIETRDSITNRVVNVQTLQEGEDYTVDPFKGSIILSQPLQAFSTHPDPSDPSVDGTTTSLVVSYQYVPTLEEVDKLSTGVDGRFWVNEYLQIGAQALRQAGEWDSQDYRVYGAQARLRLGENSEIGLEFAQSEGRHIASSSSQNGGISYQSNDGIAGAVSGQAYKVSMDLDASRFVGGAGGTQSNGRSLKFGGYYENYEKGFSNAQSTRNEDEEAFGVYGSFALQSGIGLNMTYDVFLRENELDTRKANLELQAQFAPNLRGLIGGTYSDVERYGAVQGQGSGARFDVNARLEHRPNDALSYYGFAQATVQKGAERDSANRVGLGANYQLSPASSVTGEVSMGDGGGAGELRFEYQSDAQTFNYFGYQHLADRRAVDQGRGALGQSGFVIGQRRQHNSEFSSYFETAIHPSKAATEFNSAIGFDYQITSNWLLNAQYETGQIHSNDEQAKDHEAASVRIDYEFAQNANFGTKVEYRQDTNTDGLAKEETWAVVTHFDQAINPDWRLSTGIELVNSHSDERDFYVTDYLRADMGFAYRPVDNDRLDALFLYSYLQDRNPSSAGTQSLGQESQVLATDVMYDVSSLLSIGGKYALRSGEIEVEPESGVYVQSNAQLAIARADVHIAQDWDVLFEYRNLSSQSAAFAEDGGLVAVYKDFGENYKFGVGYNFTDFSDDLTDLDRDQRGVFFNFVAKF